MALTSKKYSAVHNKTGGDKNKLKANFDEGHINTFTDLADNGTSPEFGALIYQIQEMQDELDYLRTEISSNKDNKTVIGSNTTISFGDMVTTLVKGKPVYTIVMTVVYTNPSNSKTTTKATILTLT